MSQMKFILEMHESIGGEKSYDILTCAENAFDKIQNLFLIKKATLKKMENKQNRKSRNRSKYTMITAYAKGGISKQRKIIDGVESTGTVIHKSLQLFFKVYIYALYKCFYTWYIHNKVIYNGEDPALVG